MRFLLFLLSFFLGSCAGHDYRLAPRPLPVEIPAPRFYEAALVSFEWNGDPTEAYGVIIRRLFAEEFDITLNDPVANIIRAEAFSVDVYLSNRNRRMMTKAWNEGNEWFRSGMLSEGGPGITIYRRIALSFSITSNKITVLPRVEHRSNRSNDEWKRSTRITETDVSLISDIIREATSTASAIQAN